MQGPAASMLAAPGASYRAYFAFADVLRRAQSEILERLDSARKSVAID